MEFIRPLHPSDLVDRVGKEYPVNCLGCEHLRALPDKTTLCAYGGSPRKVDVLDPLRTIQKCKYREDVKGTKDAKGSEDMQLFQTQSRGS